MKRSKMGLRALNEQHLEMSDAPLAPVTRELKAMTSVRGLATQCAPVQKGSVLHGERLLRQAIDTQINRQSL